MDDAPLREKLSLNAGKTAEQYFDCRIIAQNIEAAFGKNF
jgi:hypothetical protein